MICKNCGEKLKDDAKYWSKCGRNVETSKIHKNKILLKYYLISEYDIEEYRSPGYIYSKYNITEDYTVDFSKIRKLKFKDGRTKKHWNSCWISCT